jgi:kumamolisin
MKNKNFFGFLKGLTPFVLLIALELHAAQSEHATVRLSGHLPSQAVSKAVLLNPLDATSDISLTFVLPLRNQEALEELVGRMYDPADSQYYRKYLTSQEFAERFSPTQEDYDQLIAHAQSLGLTVKAIHSNRTLLNVSAPAKTIETAFNLRLHRYQKASGQVFYAPDNEPEIAHHIASMIHGIVGLDNHAKWRTYNKKKHKTTHSSPPAHVHPSGPGGGYSPSDLLTAYNLTNVSANGSNQIIALFELGKYQASDINTYTKQFGLPTPKLHNVLVDGGASGGIDAEVTLDIELALALAPQSQIYVYEGPNSDQGVLDTYNRIATDNLAKQVSTSWGLGEDNVNAQYLQAENAIFLQMAAHGQTIYAAGGDSGAYDDYPSRTLVVDDPASQPYVIGVGGTKLTVNATSGAYSNETVWNEGLGNGAGGGGVSSYWPLPSWQKNVVSEYSKTHRNVPDVALNADPSTGYSIYYNGQWTIFGGTSCAAPLWAAFTARVNQQLTAAQKPVLGFANPLFYAIGIGSATGNNFHDITSGNNLHYSAVKSYDNATGWGSFNGGGLFATLTSSVPTTPSHQMAPQFSISMTHSAPFTRGKSGSYTLAVSNRGDTSTSDTISVVVALPTGLKCTSLSGSGWTCDTATLVCTQETPLAAGSSYPPITLIVDVDAHAPRTVSPVVTVSGGGSTTSKSTSNLTIIR